MAGWSDGIQEKLRVDKKVESDLKVTAYFRKKHFQVTYKANLGGDIQGISKQSIEYQSESEKVVAVPASGYRFLSWSDGVLTPERNDFNVRPISKCGQNSPLRKLLDAQLYLEFFEVCEREYARDNTANKVILLYDEMETSGLSDSIFSWKRNDDGSSILIEIEKSGSVISRIIGFRWSSIRIFPKGNRSSQKK